VSKMSFLSPSALSSAACSSPESPLDSSSVSSNSLSESAPTGSTLSDFGPPGLLPDLEPDLVLDLLLGLLPDADGPGSSESSKSSESSSTVGGFAFFLSLFSPFFSSEIPLSAGSRRLIPLPPLRCLPLLSLGTSPRSTSSLESVFSCNSKSSLSESRLSSNSLLSSVGVPGLERPLPESDAVSFEDALGLGGESLADPPPLMRALPGPLTSREISSVGTTAASSLCAFPDFGASSRTSLSPADLLPDLGPLPLSTFTSLS